MVLNTIRATIFLFLTGPGIVGNISVFVKYTCAFFSGTATKSVHLLSIHLVFTNTVILLSKVTLKTIAMFGVRNVLGDTGCKAFVFLERVARGLSISTSSFLAVVQATTISPRAPVPAGFKPASARHILPFCLFFWVLNSLVSMNLLYYVRNTSSLNRSQASHGNSCSYVLPRSQIMKWMFPILMALRDFLFLSLMGWASAYLVLLLHKHHRHVLYLQKSKILHQTPPAERRAAHSVLLLMLCFLLFYWTDCILSLGLNFSLENASFVLNIQEFLTLGYAILSPFVLIHRDGRRVDVGTLNKAGTTLFFH
ncbi:LOW QUALITY PROTEIN: putative vomeronasal receptor-like protein 4 [Prionailurus bengalensis]|uniref:LOW QUALITY PROTEIN: putative vomeronasal receptor-like protein 4 n=1 Tax=Prionailurus bengalensis TaxID=37029 RepID=UPI001CA9E8D3|nr:LOW QUALITY PROTEIN: putative vomeronasal receptor-like protein 4 [Prionailurus bengalensis]